MRTVFYRKSPNYNLLKAFEISQILLCSPFGGVQLKDFCFFLLFIITKNHMNHLAKALDWDLVYKFRRMKYFIIALKSLRNFVRN